jgi:hypothetical protein
MSAAFELGRVPEAGPRDAADRAILRTLAYASLFQFPPTLPELHRSLMDVPLSEAELAERLRRPPLSRSLRLQGGLVVLRGREDWLALRRERAERTVRLLEAHRAALERIARFPFVRLVALSGSCAHGNAADGDVDVFLIGKAGRAWVVTLALFALCRAMGVRRTLCLNYVVDEEALALPERDLFTAAEIVGMRPLAGGAAYRRFVRANAWAAVRFPNFFASFEAFATGAGAAGSPRLEALLDRGPAPLLESFARRVLGARLARRTRGCPGVVLSPHRLKLHTRDHRPELSAAFAAALAAAGEAP